MQTRPERQLGTASATFLVVGSMIGTGVFVTPGYLIADLGSGIAVLTTWAVGGLAAACGAVAYAELGAALPENGGEYRLLSRIYHPAVGVCSAFVSLVVGFSAPLAVSALAFGRYAREAIGWTIPDVWSGLGVLVVASSAHAFRTQLGAHTQNWSTAVKVLLLIVFIAAGLTQGDVSRIAAASDRPLTEALWSPGFAVAVVYVSFAYAGWNSAVYVAGELKHPEREIPRALGLGTGLVISLYLGLTAVFLASGDAEALVAAKEGASHVAASRLFGPVAGRVVSGLIAVGLVSMIGAMVMTGPRVYEALGEDYRALRWLRRPSPGAPPTAATLLQSLLAGGLLVVSGFDTLMTFAGFTLSVVSGLTVAGVFVLRRREPELARPYRAFGHPWTTTAFLALMAWMIAFALYARPTATLAGVGTIAGGLLLYAGVRRSRVTPAL